MKKDAGNTVPPPDGGWAWMIALASCYCNFVILGLLKCYGVFMVEFLEVFPGLTTLEASLVSGLASAFALIPAPFTSNLGKFVGYRKEMCAGAFVAFLGYALSLFCTSFYHLYFTMGILFGLGASFSWIPAIANIGMYFERRRSTVNGFVAACSPLSVLILSPVIERLLDEYGYKGTLLIVSGLILNMVPAAALYRSPQDIKPPKKRRLQLAKSQIPKTSQLEDQGTVDETEMNLSTDAVNDGHTSDPDDRELKGLGKTKSLETPAVGLDIIYASCQSLPIEEHQAEELKSRAQDSCWKKFYISATDPKAPLVKFSLLRNHQLQVLTMCLMTALMCYPNFYIYLPVRGMEIGYSKEDGAMLLSIMSVVEVIVRICIGFFWDTNFVRHKVGYANVYAGCVCLAGISAATMNISEDYTYFAASASIFGAISAGYIVVTPALLVELVGLENLVPSIGILYWLQSAVLLAGPTFLGSLRDMTGDAKVIFYVMGALQVFGGTAMFILMPFAARRECRKSRANLQDGKKSSL